MPRRGAQSRARLWVLDASRVKFQRRVGHHATGGAAKPRHMDTESRVVRRPPASLTVGERLGSANIRARRVGHGVGVEGSDRMLVGRRVKSRTRERTRRSHVPVRDHATLMTRSACRFKPFLFGWGLEATNTVGRPPYVVLERRRGSTVICRAAPRRVAPVSALTRGESEDGRARFAGPRPVDATASS